MHLSIILLSALLPLSTATNHFLDSPVLETFRLLEEHFHLDGPKNLRSVLDVVMPPSKPDAVLEEEADLKIDLLNGDLLVEVKDDVELTSDLNASGVGGDNSNQEEIVSEDVDSVPLQEDIENASADQNIDFFEEEGVQLVEDGAEIAEGDLEQNIVVLTEDQGQLEDLEQTDDLEQTEDDLEQSDEVEQTEEELEQINQNLELSEEDLERSEDNIERSEEDLEQSEEDVEEIEEDLEQSEDNLEQSEEDLEEFEDDLEQSEDDEEIEEDVEQSDEDLEQREEELEQKDEDLEEFEEDLEQEEEDLEEATGKGAGGLSNRADLNSESNEIPPLDPITSDDSPDSADPDSSGLPENSSSDSENTSSDSENSSSDSENSSSKSSLSFFNLFGL